MNKIALYLMNKKGLNILLNLIKNERKSNIKYVISSKDKNMENDFYLEIKEICKKNNITFLIEQITLWSLMAIKLQ